jgi:hypothetical protein
MLVSDAIEETRRLLFTGGIEERNKLASAVTSGNDTLEFVYDLGSIDRGAKLSVNLEDMYVWSKTSQTATVDRGQFGTYADDHGSESVVHVNPKFSNYEIFKAINHEIASLSSPVNGLYRVIDYMIDYSPVTPGYDFPFEVLDIYQVRYRTPGPNNSWYISQNWEFTNNAGDDFASGKALFIHDAYPFHDVLVKVKTPFEQLPSSLSVDISATGLPETAYDVLPLGAAYRLTSTREIRRNFDEVQGDTRRAQEVPPGANLGGARELGRLRDQRIREESARLSLQYPTYSPRYPFAVGG